MNENTLAFNAVGTCQVRAYQPGDVNWAPATDITRTFAVVKAPAEVRVTNSIYSYDGMPKTALVKTDPSYVTYDVTYNGATSRPVNAGVYTVAVTVTDDNYQGGAKGSLSISRENQTLSFPNPGTQAVTNIVTLKAAASSGLPVNYTVDYGPAVLVHPTFRGSRRCIMDIFPGGGKIKRAAAGVRALSRSEWNWVSRIDAWPSLIERGGHFQELQQ